MRVIATGLSGTIGRHVQNATSYLGDIRDPDGYDQLNGHDCFLHLAGVVGTKTVANSKKIAHEINVGATLNLAKEALNRNYSQFIYVSTSHVYGNASGDITEETKAAPLTEYAFQKLKAENQLREVFRNSPTRLVILRLFSILGNGMPAFTLGGLLDQLTVDPSLKVSCSQDVRDFLAPTQAGASLTFLAHEEWGVEGTYNLCSGTGLSVKDASKMYLSTKGYTADENRFEPGFSPVPRIVGSNRKLISEIPGVQKYIAEFRPSMNEN